MKYVNKSNLDTQTEIGSVILDAVKEHRRWEERVRGYDFSRDTTVIGALIHIEGKKYAGIAHQYGHQLSSKDSF